MKRIILALLLCFVLAATMVGCQSEPAPEENATGEETGISWPEDSITIICPTKAGGNSDGQVRMVANYLQEKTGKPFVVLNLSEGRGSVGYDRLKNAEPDGNTLMLYHASFPVAVHTGSYEANIDEDYTIISTAQNGGYATICVRADSPYDTLQDLIDDAKANPGKLKWGTSLGRIPHMFAVMLEKEAGIDLDIVDADGEVALLGGHIDMTNMTIAMADQNVQAGKMKILAVLTPERCPYFPDYPTAAEQGYPTVQYDGNFGLYGPAGMDEDLVAHINSLFKDFGDSPENQEFLERNGRTFTYRTVEESREALKREENFIADMVKVMFE